MENIKRIDDNTVEIDGKVYDVRKEKKSLQGETKYKIGTWYVNARGNLFRVNDISKDEYGTSIFWDSESGHVGLFRCGSSVDMDGHPATYAEIKSHLSKICARKYTGERVKSLQLDKDGVVVKGGEVQYYMTSDDFWMERKGKEGDGLMICVYEQGKWAEILPDKKPLPKTREEFKTLIDLIDKANILLPFGYMSTDEFLDQYDFE